MDRRSYHWCYRIIIKYEERICFRLQLKLEQDVYLQKWIVEIIWKKCCILNTLMHKFCIELNKLSQKVIIYYCHTNKKAYKGAFSRDCQKEL